MCMYYTLKHASFLPKDSSPRVFFNGDFHSEEIMGVNPRVNSVSQIPYLICCVQRLPKVCFVFASA